MHSTGAVRAVGDRAKPAGRALKVLLVEDDATQSLIIESELERDPLVALEVCCAENLAEALQHMRERRIDVALIDLNLPDSRGVAEQQGAVADGIENVSSRSTLLAMATANARQDNLARFSQ